MAGTQIYDLLHEDHQEVANLFRRLSNAVGGTSDVFSQLAQELSVHMTAEEKTFYSALQSNQKTSELMAEGLKEHREAEKMLRELQKITPNGTEFTAKAKELRQAVDHHVADEEGKIFPAAKKVLSAAEAEEIGTKFERQKQRINK